MKKKQKKKPTARIYTKNIALENETIKHLQGYLLAWGCKLELLNIQRVKQGKFRNKFYGLAKIRSKTIS